MSGSKSGSAAQSAMNEEDLARAIQSVSQQVAADKEVLKQQSVEMGKTIRVLQEKLAECGRREDALKQTLATERDRIKKRDEAFRRREQLQDKQEEDLRRMISNIKSLELQAEKQTLQQQNDKLKQVYELQEKLKLGYQRREGEMVQRIEELMQQLDDAQKTVKQQEEELKKLRKSQKKSGSESRKIVSGAIPKKVTEQPPVSSKRAEAGHIHRLPDERGAGMYGNEQELSMQIQDLSMQLDAQKDLTEELKHAYEYKLKQRPLTVILEKQELNQMIEDLTNLLEAERRKNAELEQSNVTLCDLLQKEQNVSLQKDCSLMNKIRPPVTQPK